MLKSLRLSFPALGPGLIGIGLLALPGVAHAAGFDVDHATRAWLDTVQGAARARSDAYFDGRLWIDLWGAVIGVLACWVLLRVRLLPAAQIRLQRKGYRPWLVILACAALFTLAYTMLTLPWSVYADFLREKDYGLMNQSFGGWLGDQTIGLGLSLVFGSLFVLAIYAVIRRFPRAWWMMGTALVAAVLALVMLVYPVFVAPMFNTYTELPAGPVRDRITAMATEHGVPARHIFLFDASRQSDRISANVSGFGPTIRISLNDNLLKRSTLPETASVMGHEMGHYVLGHIWWKIVTLTPIAGLLLWLTARIVPGVIRRNGRRWGVRDIGDPASLPVVTAVFTVLSLLALPLTNAVTRIPEAQADAFGLDAAKEPDAFASVAMKLAEYRKIQPGWLEETLFYDHPSGATRVRMAMQWKKDHVPGAQEVVPPKAP